MLQTKLNYENVITIFRLLIFFVYVFLLCLLIRTGQFGVNQNVFIKDLISNWERRGIKTIYKENYKNKKCENEFFERKWEGTPPACDCRTKIIYGEKGIFNSQCSFMQIATGCKNVNSIDSFKVSNWKGSKLCVKYHEYNYFDSVTVVGDKCPKKYLLCGIDTKNFGLCFPKKFGCPVNKVKVTNHPSAGADYETVLLNEDWYLHFSNQHKNESLVIDVRYSEGRVCMNPEETNIKPYLKFKKEESTNYESNNLSILSKNNVIKTSACVMKIGIFNFDERFKIIDSVSKFKFYTDNNILKLIEKLPQLRSQDLINYNSFIYQRSYVHWSPYCRNDLELAPKTIINDLLNLSTLDSYFEFSTIYFLNIFILFLVYFVFTKSVNLSQNIDSLLEYVFIVLLSAMLPVLIIITYLLDKNKYLIGKFINQKCGDYSTNLAFIDIGKNLSKLTIAAYEIILWLTVLILLLIVQKVVKWTKINIDELKNIIF